MAQFMKGDIIVVPFPFSDLTQAKRRPALILAELAGDDRILCQITSQKVSDRYAIKLDDSDLESGGLKQKSNIRPNRIFTCDIQLILYRVGHMKHSKLDEVIEKVVEIIRS